MVAVRCLPHSLQFWRPAVLVSVCILLTLILSLSKTQNTFAFFFTQGRQLKRNMELLYPAHIPQFVGDGQFFHSGPDVAQEDQIIITLTQKREEWETQQSLIHSTDGNQLSRVSKTSALQERKFLDWALRLLPGRDFLSIDLCGPLLCSVEGPFCLFFLATSKMGFENIFHLEALSIL